MTVTVVLDTHLRIPLAAVPPEVRRAMRADLTLPNPRYVAAVKQGRPVGRMSPTVTLYREVDGWLVLPRGYAAKAAAGLLRAGLGMRFVDKRLRLPEVSFSFRGELLPYQARYGSSTPKTWPAKWWSGRQSFSGSTRRRLASSAMGSGGSARS